MGLNKQRDWCGTCCSATCYPCGNSVYMVGSCDARLLHIIHVSAVSEVGVLQRKLSVTACAMRQFKFKLKLPPRLAADTRVAVNAPVVCLCFYFVVQLWRRRRAACRVQCKCSFRCQDECSHSKDELHVIYTGLIQGLRPANERRRYFATTSLIGWAQS